MGTPKFVHAAPEVLEAKRIAEIQSLTYVERMERLFVLIEISWMMKNAKRIYQKPKTFNPLNPENL